MKTRLNNTYLVALFIIAAAVIAGELVVQFGIRGSKKDAVAIQLAGYQLSYSQSIAKHALGMSLANNRLDYEKNQNDLRKTIIEFTQNQEALQVGDEKKGVEVISTQEMKNAFSSIEKSYQTLLEASNRLIALPYSTSGTRKQEVFDTNIETIQKAETEFGERMNEIIHLYEQGAQDRIRLISLLAWLVGATIIVILILLGIFFFKPLMKKIEGNLQQINEVNNKLSSQDNELRKTLEKQLQVSEELYAAQQKAQKSEEEAKKALRQALEANDRLYLAQKDLEAAQKETQQVTERLKIALAGSNDGIWDWDLTNNQVYFAPRWKEMLGYPDHDLPNELSTFMNLQHPEDAPRVTEVLNQYLEGKSDKYEIEFRMKTKQGDYKWILARGLALRDINGKPYRMAGSHTDIDERKQEVTRMELLSMVASKTHNAIIITDAEGRIEWVNKGFTTITEYELSEVMGKKPGSFLQGEETNPDDVQKIREGLASREIFTHEIYNYSKSGRGYWLSLNISPVFDDKGELIQFIAIEADVTARKEAEQQLKFSLEMQQVISETLSLSQKEVERKNEELQNSESELLKNAEKRLELTEQILISQMQLRESLKIAKMGHWSLQAESDGNVTLTFSEEYFENILNTSIAEQGSGSFSLQEWMDKFVHPEDFNYLLAEMAKGAGKPVFKNTIEFRMVRPGIDKLTKEIIYVSATIDAEFDPRSNKLVGRGIAIDITELKKSQEVILEKERIVKNQNQLLTKLTTTTLEQFGSLENAFKAITEAGAEGLNTHRVSIWSFDKEKAICNDLYEGDKQRHSSGGEFLAQDFPIYFKALVEGEVIIAPEAHAHPITIEFSEVYKKMGVESVLSVPIRIAGEVVGLISCANVNSRKEWVTEDESFVRSLADVVALIQEAEIRKQAELKLKESEKELKEAFKLAQMAKWSIEIGLDGTNGKFTVSDEYYELLLGTNAAEQGGNEISVEDWMVRFVVPEDMAIIQASFMEAFSHQEYKTTLDFRLKRWDNGDIINVTTIVTTNLHLEENKMRGFGTIQNITELKAAETKIKQSQEQLKAASKVAKLGAWSVEGDLTKGEILITFSDEIYENVLGTNIAEQGQYTMPFEEYAQRFIYPEDIAYVMGTVQQAASQPEYRALLEYRMIRFDTKEVINTLANVNATMDPEQMLLTANGVFQDITSLKETENRLKESQKDLKDAFRIAKMGHWTIESDLQGSVNVLLSEEYYEILLGTTAKHNQEIPFQTWVEKYLVLEDLEAIKGSFAKVRELLQTQESCSIELEYRLRNQSTNEVINVAAVVSAYFDKQKQMIIAKGTAQDVTSLKKAQAEVNHALEVQRALNESMKLAQQELAKKNHMLSQSEEDMRNAMEKQLEATEKMMIAEANLKKVLEEERKSKEELDKILGRLKDTQSQLVHSEKMASLGQLTAGIAHEINNPINFVYNGIDTLKISLDDLMEIVDKYAQLDSANGNKEGILEEIIELKNELDYDELIADIQHLVADIKKGAIRTIEIVKGLRVFSRLDEEERKPAKISECLDATLILLNNKFKNKVEIKKYYDDSMPEIMCYPGQLNQVFMNIINNAIQAIPEERKDGKVEIYTENLQENVVIRIKDNGSGMSEQTKRRIFEPFFTTKAVGVGTGLGLSITFGIIEKHEGTIYVNSEEGKGSEFVIQLPKKVI